MAVVGGICFARSWIYCNFYVFAADVFSITAGVGDQFPAGCVFGVAGNASPVNHYNDAAAGIRFGWQIYITVVIRSFLSGGGEAFGIGYPGVSAKLDKMAGERFADAGEITGILIASIPYVFKI